MSRYSAIRYVNIIKIFKYADVQDSIWNSVHLPNRLKNCISNVFSFLQGKICARKIGRVLKALRARAGSIGIWRAICPGLTYQKINCKFQHYCKKIDINANNNDKIVLIMYW